RQRRLERCRVGQQLEALAERAVADLVVVLQEVDEGGWRQRAARLAARTALAMRRALALIVEACRQHAGDARERRLAVVAIVSVRLAAQEHVPGVVKIVVPLGTESSGRRRGA